MDVYGCTPSIWLLAPLPLFFFGFSDSLLVFQWFAENHEVFTDFLVLQQRAFEKLYLTQPLPYAHINGRGKTSPGAFGAHQGRQFLWPSPAPNVAFRTVFSRSCKIQFGFAEPAFAEADEDDSPVDDTSSAPVSFRISLALIISPEVSQCSDSNTPPFFKWPS